MMIFFYDFKRIVIKRRIKIIGVTILTSLNNKALKEIGYNKDVKKLVIQQVKLANKAKLDAIVCSPLEVSIVKKVFKKEIITPGIRFNLKNDDQKRILTPKQAYKNGSDWLVIGRPITEAPDPAKAAEALLNEIQ